MKKLYISTLILILSTTIANAAATAFDSMDKAVEVKLSPQIKTQNTAPKTTSTPITSQNAVQVQKYTNALVNLDDAQVELRQDLTSATAKYNDALVEKQKAAQRCKELKKEIRAINKKMKNVDKSKKMINANLQTGK